MLLPPIDCADCCAQDDSGSRPNHVKSAFETFHHEAFLESEGYASVPPSTGIAMPVTNEALSDNRNAATSAISSGRAARPIGLRVTAALISCSGSASL